MRFKLDENLPGLVRATFEKLGHDAHTVAGELLAGADDGAVLDASAAEGRVGETLDLDFAHMQANPHGTHAGIRELHPESQPFMAIEVLVRAGLLVDAGEKVEGQRWVIDTQRACIRDA